MIFNEIVRLSIDDLGGAAREVTGKAIESINESEVAAGLAQGIINSLPDSVLNKLSLFLDIGKLFLLILIIYFAILIIRSLMKIRDSSNINALAKSAKERNKKLDVIILQNEKLLLKIEKGHGKKEDKKEK